MTNARAKLIAILAAGVLVASGCGGADSDSDSDAGTSTPAPTATLTATATPESGVPTETTFLVFSKANDQITHARESLDEDLSDCADAGTDVAVSVCFLRATEPLGEAITAMQDAYENIQSEAGGDCADALEESEDSLIDFKQQYQTLNGTFENGDYANADVAAFAAEFTRYVDDTNEALTGCAPPGVTVG